MEKIGKYEVVRELGQGGMGKVYEARDLVLGRTVAIKLMMEAQLVDEVMRTRFYREARAAGNLKHPNIVTIYDLSEEENVPYIVMEYLEGVDLSRLLKNRQDFPLADRVKIAIQVANGLSYAHKNGVVHRDIKPANIQVLEGNQVKIVDFGVAQLATSEMTKSGSTLGTPHYMSPEQIVGKRVDHRTDIWALGIIIFEMVAGRRPFEAESIATLVYQIAFEQPPALATLGVEAPEPLVGVLARALAKEPADRYRDASELARDLENFLSLMTTPVGELGAEVERDIVKYIQLANALLLKKEFDEAADAARRALALEEARLAGTSETWDPARSEAKRVLDQIDRGRERAQREQEALALAEQAQSLLGESRPDEALERIEEAVALAPESTTVGKLHAEIASRVDRMRRERAIGERLKGARQAFEVGNFSEAADGLRTVLDLDPQNAEATRLLASVGEAAQDEEERQRNKQAATERFKVARQAFEATKLIEAATELRTVLDLDPHNAEAKRLLALVSATQTAREDEDRRKTEQAVAGRVDAARQAFEANQLSQAATELRAALDLDPHSAEAKTLLASVSQAVRAQEEAEQALTTARGAMQRREYTAARHLLEAALARYPDDAKLRGLLREVADAQALAAGAPTMVRPSGAPRAAPDVPQGPGPTVLLPSPKPRVAEKVPIPPRVPPTPAPSLKAYLALAAAVVVGGVAIGVYFSPFWPRPEPVTPQVALAPGFVSISVAPWAEIRSLRDLGSGEIVQPETQVTPCFLSLPAGTYEIEFANPHFAETLTTELTVEAGEIVELRAAIPGFNHADFLVDF